MSQSNDFTMKELLKFSDTQLILLALGERNPGAHTVIAKLFEIIEKDAAKHYIIMDLIEDLMDKNIVGARLWYIYKNESKMDINNLLNLNLDVFTDEYFYEKFEKYTENI